MTAVTGCHKDSFNFDEFTRPTTATPDTNPDNDDGTGTPDDGDEIPVPMNLPVVSIATGDMPVEDGAGVTLTITSSETVPATLTGGLSVTINIVGADAADFNNAVCTNLVCIVTIPAGSNSVSLILSPLSDFSTETERWTATLEDGDDYNLDAGNNNVGFDITDLIAAIGIMTSDMPIEGGAAVTLTISSSDVVPATLTDGLSVTINIVGADAADFNNAVCTGLVCIVTIPAGSNSVSLILSPLSDFSTETGERWTATLVDDDDNDYNLDAGNNNVGFDIDDLIAVVDIMTSDTTAIENGAAVTLTISSTLPAPAGGLSVTINIGVAMDGEFTANAEADCTTDFPRCIVTIPENERSVNLTLSPLSDFSTEPGERWTATLVDTGAYNPAAGGDDNVAFDITDLIADISILPSASMATEGGAIALTITSSINAPVGGLSVTVSIGGISVVAADISSANTNCNGLICEVVILSGTDSVVLNLMPASGDESENPESWTATIRPVPTMFNTPDLTDEATFTIENFPLPMAANLETLANLNAYDIPTALSVNLIRNLQSDAVRGVAITASRYDDASGNPQVYVQLLEFAALGVWVNGNAPDIGVFDHINYDYAFLGDNVVATLPTSGSASYSIEGDAIYKGVNFFPDGIISANFGTGGNVNVLISADGSNATNRADDYGDANAMVPMTGGGMRPATATDNINIQFTGTIIGNEFQGTPIITGGGFFADLAGFDSAASSFSGRFYDSVPNPATAPRELAGVMEIVDDQGNLEMGFLGRRP